VRHRYIAVSALPLLLLASACGQWTGGGKGDPAAAYARGDLPAAEAAIQAALDASPDNRDLLLLGGRIALEQGDYERAKARLAKLAGMTPPVPMARVLLAKAQLLSSGGQAALDTMKGAPLDSGEAYAVVAGANLALGKGGDGVALIEKGLSAFPKSPDLLAIKGEVALAVGDVASARQDADAAHAAAPEHIEAALLGAHVALAEHRTDDAAKILEGILKLRPDNVGALISLAAIRHDHGDTKAAEAMFARAAGRLDGRSAFARYYLAQMAFDAGDVARAEQLVQGMDRKDVPQAEMLNGLIAAKRGQPQQAIAALGYYLSHGQDDPRARLVLAGMQAQTGDQASAWATIAPLAAAANAGPPVLTLAAAIAADLGRPESGSLRARAAAAAHRDPDAGQMSEADKAMQNGDWRKADALYTQVLAHPLQGDTGVIALNNAALAKLELGDMAGAQGLARRARAAAPNDPIVADTLGWVLFRSGGASGEAVALVKSALAAQPANPEIRRHAMAMSRAMQSNH
jgi:predicted Zn-dependent protease